MSNVRTKKQTLRQAITAKRAELSAEERTRLSQEITHRLTQLESYKNAQNLFLYLNFGAEYESKQFAEQCLRDGKQIWLPRAERIARALEIYRVTDLEQDIAPGTWNIPEPIPNRCERLTDLDQLDFILLPGIAFTHTGDRIGYGGGYYDRILTEFTRRPALVAGTYSLQIVDSIPLEPFDQPIDWLVTENETIHCAQERE